MAVSAGTLRAEEDPAQAIGVISQTIETMRSIATVPSSGMGTAIVRTEDNGKVGEASLDFRFKDQQTRSDLFPLEDGVRADRQGAWAESPNSKISYAKRHVLVEAKPPLLFHRQFGYDFHPETFTTIQDRPLVDQLGGLLKNLKDGNGTCVVTATSDGILHIVYDHKSKGRCRVEVDIDTANGMRLLGYRDSIDDLYGPGSYGESRTTLIWKDYNGTMFVETASIEESARGVGTPPLQGKDGVEGQQTSDSPTSRPAYQSRNNSKDKHEVLTRRKTVKVVSFTPNAPVDDRDFSLAGLDVPRGVLVSDRIAGLSYRFGMPSANELQLSAALTETTLPVRVARAGLVSKTQPATRLSEPMRAVDARLGDFHWKRWLLSVCGLLAIGVLGAWLYCRARKGSRTKQR